MLDKKYKKWFPQLTRETLETYGDCKIIKLFIGKHDLHQKFLRYTIMNILSDGKWSKELIKRNLNKITHTYIITRVMYEGKGVDIMISKEFYLTCNTLDYAEQNYPVKRETYEIEKFDSDYINITINKLLEDTIKNIGDEKYFLWTPWSSCQDFSKDILVTIDSLNYKHLLCNKNANSIRLYDDEAKKFTVQNLDIVFKEMPDRVHSFLKSYTSCVKKLYEII
jgi:hypothetical protein